VRAVTAEGQVSSLVSQLDDTNSRLDAAASRLSNVEAAAAEAQQQLQEQQQAVAAATALAAAAAEAAAAGCGECGAVCGVGGMTWRLVLLGDGGASCHDDGAEVCRQDAIQEMGCLHDECVCLGRTSMADRMWPMVAGLHAAIPMIDCVLGCAN
jgi:exonuclease VII small subunit